MPPPNVIAPLLAAFIVLGYAASLWWLLRREPSRTLWALLVLCSFSLSLRLVYTTEYPPGFNEDEPKVLRCAADALAQGRLLSDCIAIPVLLHALFEAQLIPLLGPTRWAIRSYSMVCSILATPAAFAFARALGWRTLPSLAGGAFVAVLPWALFYARVFDGGELVFHQLLLLAALARLVFGAGAWAELGIGTFALTLLLYDYFCGRAMAPMPLVAAVLANGWRRRALCVLMIPLAFLLFWPHFRQADHTWGLSAEGLHEGFFTAPLETLRKQTIDTLQTFIKPVARDDWRTIATAAMHPTLVLLLAIAGAVFSGWRRALFLSVAFVGGLAPAIISWGYRPSTHRMLMAFPLVAVAAGGAFDALPWRRVRLAAVAVAVAVVSFQSISFFFSPAFWPAQSAATFDWERTAITEALPYPPHPRLIAIDQFGYFGGPRFLVDKTIEPLRAENWYPRPGEATIYAFTQQAAPLRGFYDHLFGPERVRSFGRAFMVTLEAADWAWLRQHGWAHEVTCDEVPHTAQVLTLFSVGWSFEGLHCGRSVEHRWGAQWNGPATTLRLRFSGQVSVDVNGQPTAEAEGRYAATEFAVSPGAHVVIRFQARPERLAPEIQLYETLPIGERVPAWEKWVPHDAAREAEPVAAEAAQLVEGFARIVHFQHTQDSYPDYRGGTQSWWFYASGAGAELAWQTAPVPATKVTAVAFTASLGSGTGTAHLWVNGEFAVTFGTGNDVRKATWRRGGYALSFESKQLVHGNSGVFTLRVPAEVVQPGRPLELRVRITKATGEAWFMVKGYTDTIAHEKLTVERITSTLRPGPAARR